MPSLIRILLIVGLLVTQSLAGSRCHGHDQSVTGHDGASHVHLHLFLPIDHDDDDCSHDRDAVDLPEHDTQRTNSLVVPSIDAHQIPFLTRITDSFPNRVLHSFRNTLPRSIPCEFLIALLI